MLALMHELVQNESQFIVATHSPILMAYPQAIIFECGADGIKKVSYDDTEHVKVMRDFMAHPERTLNALSL